MCNYCNKHLGYDYKLYPRLVAWDETTLAKDSYTSLTIGVDKSDDIVMVAYGDDEAVYHPKFCPECGADLAYRKAKY